MNLLMGALAAAGLLFSLNGNAQENANRDADGNVVRGAYETNGAFDNIFVGGGLGINSAISRQGGIGYMGLATDLYAGKWWTPAVGARLGWHGLSTEMKGSTYGQRPFNYFHADVLWNISNTIDGYVETRFWNFVPYFTSGFVGLGGTNGGIKSAFSDLEFEAGLGLLNNVRLTERLNCTLDLGMLVGKAAGYGFSTANGGKFMALPYALVGVAYNLGKTGFSRHTSVTPAIIPVPFTLNEYNDLSEKVAALEKENAELKAQVADLQKIADKFNNLVDGQTYLFQNGAFTAVEAQIASPVTLYFDCGSAQLSQRELAHLEYFASQVVSSDTELLVTGSADKQTGSARRNQVLSEQRANYVKNLLVKKYGANGDNIEVVAEGATNNIFNTPAKNRVVTVKVK